MDFIASAARPAYALASLPLCAAARGVGWVASPALPGELLFGAAFLELGCQKIAVRMVQNTGPDIERLLEHLRRDALGSEYLEQVIVMVGFRTQAIGAYRESFKGIRTHRIVVGTPEDYLAWLKARLGPIQKLGRTSVVRRLAEDLLALSAATALAAKDEITDAQWGADIIDSVQLGELGVQGVGTLFRQVKGLAAVDNLESDPEAQLKGIDLAIRDSISGGAALKVEVKTENFTTCNISLEKWSVFKPKPEGSDNPWPPTRPFRQKIGWLHSSLADILITVLWKTGDVLIMDFAEVKNWVATTPREVLLKIGKVPGQDYLSQVHLANIEFLLEDLPGTLHLRLGDWLPALYKGQFRDASLVQSQKHKTLHPQRLV